MNHLLKLITIKKTKIGKKNHKRQQESLLKIVYISHFFNDEFEIIHIIAKHNFFLY